MNRRLLLIPVAVLSAALLMPLSVQAQDNAVAANQEVRIQELEGQIRQLNGQIEQLTFHIQQLTGRLDKLVADVDYRLRVVEGGDAPPLASGEVAPADTQTAANPPDQPVNQPENLDAGAPTQPAVSALQGSQSSAASQSGGTGQPRTLGTLSQGQYDAQSQQLNQGADPAAAAAAAAGAGASAQATDQTAAATGDYPLQGSSPDEQYQYAFDLLRQTKYADAEQALRTFVDQYPDNPLAGNASYWLGESYYVRKDYNNAAMTFAEGFQKYPESGKAPDSLLKLGMSLAALGETADACKALEELTARYPKANDAVKQRAAREQSKNGCN